MFAGKKVASSMASLSRHTEAHCSGMFNYFCHQEARPEQQYVAAKMCKYTGSDFKQDGEDQQH